MKVNEEEDAVIQSGALASGPRTRILVSLLPSITLLENALSRTKGGGGDASESCPC
jgi:hypothetical protein